MHDERYILELLKLKFILSYQTSCSQSDSSINFNAKCKTKIKVKLQHEQYLPHTVKQFELIINVIWLQNNEQTFFIISGIAHIIFEKPWCIKVTQYNKITTKMHFIAFNKVFSSVKTE